MNWTEDERVKVCQHLATVMEFVRILLIDSQVFAEVNNCFNDLKTVVMDSQLGWGLGLTIWTLNQALIIFGKSTQSNYTKVVQYHIHYLHLVTLDNK